MTDTQHTPGPWKSSIDSNGQGGGIRLTVPGTDATWWAPIIYGERQDVAYLAMKGGDPTAIANAHLIAVAPEMFDALRRTLDEAQHAEGCRFFRLNISEIEALPKGAEPPCNCFLFMARAAIAKAQGVSHV